MWVFVLSNIFFFNLVSAVYPPPTWLSGVRSSGWGGVLRQGRERD